MNIVSRDTDLVQSPLEPLDDAGGGGAGLAGVPLSVCGRQSCIVHTHLSPAVSLIYDLAYDRGMLQSELFTSRNQNLVLRKL